MLRVGKGLPDKRDAAHQRCRIGADEPAAGKRDMQRDGRAKDHRPSKVDGKPAHLGVDLRRDDVDERALSGNRVAVGHEHRVGEAGAGKLAEVGGIRPQQVGGLHLRAQQLLASEPFGDFAALGILRRGRGRLLESCRGVQINQAWINRQTRAFDALHIARRVGSIADRDDRRRRESRRCPSRSAGATQRRCARPTIA